MIETTTHYHLYGEFSNLSLFADDDGDIMIETGGETHIVTPTEARELADLLHQLADEADGGDLNYEVPRPFSAAAEQLTETPLDRLTRLLGDRGHTSL